MKILVTGVGSPVGAYLAEFLARDGHEVTSIYRNKVSTNKCVAKDITLVKRDLTEGILDIIFCICAVPSTAIKRLSFILDLIP